MIVSYSHVSVWKWIQHYRPKKILQRKRRKEQEFIVDKTLLKVGNQYVWVCVAIEHFDKVILGIRISFERTMLVVEGFLKDLVRKLLKTSTFNRYGDRDGIIHKLINF